MIVTFIASVSPSSGPAGGAVVKDTAISSKADRDDVVREVYWLVQSQQGNVINKLWRVKVWMWNDGSDSPTNLMWVRVWNILALSAQINSIVQSSVWGSEWGSKYCQWESYANSSCIFTLLYTSFDVNIYFVFLQVKTVSCSEHPFTTDEGPSTEEMARDV